MTRTEMLEIMKRLDARANGVLLTGASDIDLLSGMLDLMPDFKALLDSPYRGEIEARGSRMGRYACPLNCRCLLADDMSMYFRLRAHHGDCEYVGRLREQVAEPIVSQSEHETALFASSGR